MHFAPAARIVCSLELTEEAVPLLRFTQELASTMKAQVRLMHVMTDTKTPAEPEIAKLQATAGTNFPVTVAEGTLALDISDFADGQKADLIVIGRGKAQRALGSLRTHAYEIIRYAHCPVLSYADTLK
jgi:nucleotide-binding universal stress UspA family protein